MKRAVYLGFWHYHITLSWIQQFHIKLYFKQDEKQVTKLYLENHSKWFTAKMERSVEETPIQDEEDWEIHFAGKWVVSGPQPAWP